MGGVERRHPGAQVVQIEAIGEPDARRRKEKLQIREQRHLPGELLHEVGGVGTAVEGATSELSGMKPISLMKSWTNCQVPSLVS